MNAELLDIEPQELKFTFELKKQSSCSVQLVNNSNNHVAFKVKTTSPKKYCVRPNAGIVKPKSVCNFTVTMQAQRLAPLDMICKDKFLVQSTVVPPGTMDEDITSSMFVKDGGKYIEERKLRVILASLPNSPLLSPTNGSLKKEPAFEASMPKDQELSKFESLTQQKTVAEEEVEESKMEKEESKPAEDVGFKTMKEEEELKLIKHIEEMKSKLNELESKLNEAEGTILRLREEKKLTTQEKESLRQELVLLRSKTAIRRVQVGFPLLFVCMVALVGIMFGYLLHRS